MDVHQSDISKIPLSSTSTLVSFMFIKSRYFTWAYHVLLHKTSHTSCVLFFWFPRAGSRESTPSVLFEVRLFLALLLQLSPSEHRDQSSLLISMFFLHSCGVSCAALVCLWSKLTITTVSSSGFSNPFSQVFLGLVRASALFFSDGTRLICTNSAKHHQ